jgi:subtilisin family serine protease
MSIVTKAGAVACATLLAAATAHAGERYVLTASAWGKLQAAHVAAAGGTVRFANADVGVAVVESSNPQFLSQVLAGGAIHEGAVDAEFAWTVPVRTFDLDANAINPDDDRYFNTIQWAPQAVKAPQAWAAGYTGKGVRVAVIDGGIFGAHPDLAANVDVLAATSFVAPDPAASSSVNACRTAWNCDTGTLWHGTHVAGIVAAVDNTIGVVGIAPQATIVPVKALHSGSGSFGAVIQAIVYAATGGRADIINMSLGAVFERGGREGAALTSALNRAVNFAGRQGVLVISSAGNDGLDVDQTGSLIVTPAQSGNGLAVSSTGPLGFAYGATNFSRFSSYSNWGTSLVTVAGPGGDFAYEGNELCTLPTTTLPVTIPCWAFDMVLSTSRGSAASAGGYTWTAGTSMSAPAVSAVAALIKQRYPKISVGELKNRLAQSADDLGKPGVDPYYGRGFVNALNAVTR